MNRIVSGQGTNNLLQFLVLVIFVSILCIIIPNYFIQPVLAQIENSSTTTILTLPDSYSKVEKSVVQVTYSNLSESNVTLPHYLILSGFVYDKDGHIVTDAHGLTGLAQRIDITFSDHISYPASLVGFDPGSNLTVLKPKSVSTNGFIPLPLGNSTVLNIGEQVATIGSPYGLSGSLNTGIISHMDRLVPNPETGSSLPNGIQINIPVDPGAIGGPLLNMKGQVVGMDVLSYQNMGFALSSNYLSRIVDSLITKGFFAHPWLGMSGGVITPDMAQSVGLPTNYTGVVVGSVQPGSPAYKAGLQGVTQDPFSGAAHLGDIILAIDGHPIKSIDDLLNYIGSHKSVGDRLLLTTNRHGKIINMDIVLQVLPASLESRTQPTTSIVNSTSFNVTSSNTSPFASGYIIGNKTAGARLHRIPDDVTTGVEHAHERAQILYGLSSDKTRAAFSDKTVVECINDLFETRFPILNSTIEICDSAISQGLSQHLIDGSMQISLGSSQYTTLNFQDLARLYLQARNIL